MLYRHVNTDTNMYVHVCMYIYIYIHFLSYACMSVMHMIIKYIYIYHSYMQTLCYSLGRYLEHIYTYNHTTCRNILSARILWNTCGLLQLGWLGSYFITSKISNWNQEWYIHMCMHVYHVYMYKASPLHIGTHAVIILCASILWNSPKFLLKSCSIGTWTHIPTCMYMYACIWIYIYTLIFFIFMHACDANDIFIYIHISYFIFLYANIVLFLR